MRVKTKKSNLVLVAALLLFAAGAAWAGISNGKLNSDATNVDLSVDTTYPSGSAANEITLSTTVVNLTGNLTLGSKTTVTGYAATPIDRAVGSNAGGAIYVANGETLNITPNTGNRVFGANGSSLRLFGTGTTNLHGGSNYYPDTFIQSGRLNIESKAALGGSNLTLGGGATIGLVDDKGNLDLSGVTIQLRRYDDGDTEGTASFVTFDAGSRDSDSILLPGLKEVANTIIGSKSVGILKHGKGRLIFGGVAEHTGGTTVAEGTLEIRSTPQATQTIEVYGIGTLKSTLPQLFNISVKPQPGATLSIPASTAEAQTQTSDTGTAALTLAGIESAQLGNNQFKIDADLSGVALPTAAADEYYVKLVNTTSAHNLTAANVSFSGANPVIGGSIYGVTTAVDANNIYAVLTRSAAVTESVNVTCAKTGDTITATARLTDQRDGVDIRFTLRDANGTIANDVTRTSANGGGAAATFTGLTYQTYTLVVSASGYNAYSGEVKIDGSSSVQGSFVVTVYDVYGNASSDKPTALRVNIDNAPNAFPGGSSFKYNFIQTGGTATGTVANPVTDSTTFTANNVSYSDDRAAAIFDIDLSNLRADDGIIYALVPGLTYRIQVVEAGSSSSTDSSGVSDALVNSNGQYVSSGASNLATYAVRSGDKGITTWVLATQSGGPQANIRVTFTLLDRFGNAVTVPGGVANVELRDTNTNGRAEATFSPLEYGDYIIKATTSTSTGYSPEVKLGSGSSSGGGCNTGFGLLALALAFAAAKRKKS